MIDDALGFLLECACGHMIGVHFAGCTAPRCACALDQAAVLAGAIRTQYPQSANIRVRLDAAPRMPVINRRRAQRSRA